MPSTPSSGYTPLPSRPRPLPVPLRAAGAQYSVVTHSSNPPNKRTVSGRFWGQRSFLAACSITFFLDWQNSLEQLFLQLLEESLRIAAETPALHTPLPTDLQLPTQLLTTTSIRP